MQIKNTEVLNLFTEEAWEGLDPGEKFNALKSLEKMLSEGLGKGQYHKKQDRKIEIVDDPKFLGEYGYDKPEEVRIGTIMLKHPSTALYALLHERFHAYQHDVQRGIIKDPRRDIWDKAIVGRLAAPERPSDELDDILLYAFQDYDYEMALYKLQRIERDVEGFAREFCEKAREIFNGKDNGVRNTLGLIIRAIDMDRKKYIEDLSPSRQEWEAIEVADKEVDQRYKGKTLLKTLGIGKADSLLKSNSSNSTIGK